MGRSATKTNNVRYAVLGLVAQKQDEGIHGYRLKGECEALADEFWELNYGKLYRILDGLESTGDLDAETQIQFGKPNRKVYRITEKGRKTLDDWLLQPVDESPRPLRDELAVKLLFIGPENLDALNEMIKQQRSIYLNRLAKVARRRRRLQKAGLDMRATDLVLDGAEMRVRADLSWLEHVERHLIRTG